MLIFVVAISLSHKRVLSSFTRDEAPPRESAGSKYSPDALKTGSILITPPIGNICEQRVIDNQTGQIRSAGTVHCNQAVTSQPGAPDGMPRATRIEAIRDGFFQKR